MLVRISPNYEINRTVTQVANTIKKDNGRLFIGVQNALPQQRACVPVGTRREAKRSCAEQARPASSLVQIKQTGRVFLPVGSGKPDYEENTPPAINDPNHLLWCESVFHRLQAHLTKRQSAVAAGGVYQQATSFSAYPCNVV